MPRESFGAAHAGGLAAVMLFALMTPCGLVGQQPAPPPSAQPAAPSATSPNKQTKKQKKEKKPAFQYNKERVLWVAPNYLTVDNSQAPFVPMTSRQKFFLASRVSFDPFAFPEAAILAVTNSKNTRQWGNSAGGLAERYTAAFADETISTFMKKAVMPSVLRQDPRYFRLGKGNIFKRTGYAFSRVLVAKNDAGNWTFNSSNLIGTAMGATISDLYYPAPDRTFGNTLNRWGMQLAVNALDNWMREYWPDIRQRVFHK
ncbi:MAG TPA: hypothetical protein VMX16_01145 [Terriglobia bacterium]|nr:hypothetical protein [Terriglobia bacterium]